MNAKGKIDRDAIPKERCVLEIEKGKEPFMKLVEVFMNEKGERGVRRIFFGIW